MHHLGYRTVTGYKSVVHKIETVRLGQEYNGVALGICDLCSFEVLEASPQLFRWFAQRDSARVSFVESVPGFNGEKALADLASERGVHEIECETSPQSSEGRVTIRIRLFKTTQLLKTTQGEQAQINFYAFDISDFKKREIVFRSVFKLFNANRISLSDSHKNLKAILDSLPQAFFTVDSGLKIQNGYSAKAEDLLGQRLSGAQLSEVAEGLRDICELVQMLFSGVPIELVSDLVPAELQIEGRLLKVRLIPIVEDLALSKVMIALEDVTQQRQMKIALDRQNAQGKAILAILSAREDFLDLLDSAKELPTKVQNEDEMRRLTHGLKGGFGFFECHEFITICHDAESKWKESGYSTELGEVFVEGLSGAIDEFVSLHQDLLQLHGYSFGKRAPQRLKIDMAKIANLQRLALASSVNTDLVARIEGLAELPISELLAWLDRAWLMALNSIGKQGNSIQWGGQVLLARDPYKDLLKTFVHIMRNAADHGIEPPEYRLKHGKPVAGTMTIEARYEAKIYRIIFRDDGRGIDTDRVRSLAQERGIEVASDITRADLLMLLCNDKFSSKSEATELSGRGIGLNAVREEARKLGGDVIITSEMGRYTEVEVFFKRQPIFS